MSSWLILNLIWIVQRLIYPGFKYVSETSFADFHKFHVQNITPLVACLFVMDVGLSTLIFFNRMNFLSFLNLALVSSGLFLTFYLFVPLHNLLSLQKSDQLINDLVFKNKIRVLIWLFKALVSIGLIYEFQITNHS